MNYEPEAEIERIRMRCVCDEGGCWLWSGSSNNEGLPQVSRKVDGQRKVMSARRWVVSMVDSRPLLKRDYIVTTCGAKDCLNPEHLKRSNRSAIQRKSHKEDPGLRLRRGIAIKAAWARKGSGHKLTQEQADWARTCDLPVKEVAEALGVSGSMVNYIRRGKAWKATSSAFGGMAQMLGSRG